MDLGEALEVLAQQPGIGARCTARHYPDVRRLYLARTRYHVYYRVTGRTLIDRSGVLACESWTWPYAGCEAVMSNRSIDTDCVDTLGARGHPLAAKAMQSLQGLLSTRQ